MSKDVEMTDIPSKSKRKRDMLALQVLGESLLDLNAAQLDRVPMPTELREALELARSIHQRGGRRRQLQYVGRLMRQIDAEPIRAALQRLQGQDRREAAHLRRVEAWRNRLLQQDEAALDELEQRFPGTDTAQLRRLMREAAEERSQTRPPRAARALFRYLRTLLDPGDAPAAD